MKLKLVEAVFSLRTQKSIDSANSSSTVSSTNWTLIKAFYSLNTAACTCTKDVTVYVYVYVYVYVEEPFALAEKQQQKMAA